MQNFVGKYSSAPEVAYSSQPETQREYGSEGMQHDDHHDIEQKNAFILPNDARGFRPPKGRLWIATLGIFTALVALGVGIGIGYAVGNNSNSSASSRGAAQTVTITSTATPPGPTAILTETSTDVNRGMVGIAQYSCTNDTSYSSPYGVKFGKVCNTDYPGGNTVYGTTPAAGEIVSDIYQAQVYTFEACMDTCAQYNTMGTGNPCLAVTYNSNLTNVFVTQGGDSCNCWLKSDRGVGKAPPGWTTVASAYLIQP